MKRKSKTTIKQFHKDLEQLSEVEFKKRYPGVDKEALRGLSDSEIEKVAGGAVSNVLTGFALSGRTGAGAATGPKSLDSGFDVNIFIKP